MSESRNKTRNVQYFRNIVKTVEDVDKEVAEGLRILDGVNRKIVSIFGSHATAKTDKYYKHCEETSYNLGLKKYAILTGGGPGIMQAANSGAMNAKTISIGFKAGLLKKEQSVSNEIFTHQMSFKFLFARRFSLAIKSNALIFYPGGYGTLNELFEYVTLIQTHMVDPVPVICVNKKYWEGLFKWLKSKTLKQGFIQARHLKGIYFAETPAEVVKIIEKRG
ncbi:MAG: TIGR00730 family Rossman fold protein [Candidatus Woesearchaeota archaeon]